MTQLAAYSCDETGATVLDYSGNARDFTLTGTNGVRDAGGHTLGGLTKSGATMPLLPSGLLAASQSANRTVMMWVKGTGTTWYIRWQITSLDSGAWGILLLSGNIAVQARNASTLARAQFAAPADGLYHHYCGTYDGTNIYLYIDGVLKATTALAGPLRTDADQIDIMEWTTSTTLIDDLRIYDEVLSQTQIAALMNIPVAPSPVYPVSQYGSFH